MPRPSARAASRSPPTRPWARRPARRRRPAGLQRRHAAGHRQLHARSQPGHRAHRRRHAQRQRRADAQLRRHHHRRGCPDQVRHRHADAQRAQHLHGCHDHQRGHPLGRRRHGPGHAARLATPGQLVFNGGTLLATASLHARSQPGHRPHRRRHAQRQRRPDPDLRRHHHRRGCPDQVGHRHADAQRRFRHDRWHQIDAGTLLGPGSGTFNVSGDWLNYASPTAFTPGGATISPQRLWRTHARRHVPDDVLGAQDC